MRFRHKTITDSTIFMTINDIAHYPWPQRWHRAPAGTEPLECGPQRQLDGRPSAHSNTQAHYDNTMLWVR